jgi:uncharacterized protein
VPDLTDEQIEFLNSVFDAAREGDTATIKTCVDGGVPADLTNSNGDTLLILAAYHEHPETVDALLARGADTSRVNDRGQTALVAAVFRQDAGIVRALLRAGADPELGAQTAYDVAAFFGLEQMTELLPPRG